MTSEVVLLTYSTRPRGGVVHTLSLAEALQASGHSVEILALGDPATGFFRPTTVPFTILPAPAKTDSLVDKVFASIDRLVKGLAALPPGAKILHSQDCISARAAARIRDAGADVSVVRTVHHVDDFTTTALMDCQREAILEPDRVLVVSRQWQQILRDDYGVTADIVYNGVDPGRFPPIAKHRRDQLRQRVGGQDRFVFLSVGGVEPRKGSIHLFEALGALRDSLPTRPMLVIVGGHSFQDYAAYRQAALDALPGLGLTLGDDVIELGTVDDAELREWYRAADALAFPSVKEGWGLAVMEALSADLPVIASDLPVFQEYLTDGHDALLAAAGDGRRLAQAMERMVMDPELRDRLRSGGRALLPRFTWDASARRHQEIYAQILSGRSDRRGPDVLTRR